MNAEERFLAKVKPDLESGCWIWTASKYKGGYGQFSFEGQKVQAHRWAYEHWVGPIAEGLQIDHVYERGCRSTSCVFPQHLEPVTPSENQRRGERGRKTHCAHDHEYTTENTGRNYQGRRYCLECARIRDRARPERPRRK